VELVNRPSSARDWVPGPTDKLGGGSVRETHKNKTKKGVLWKKDRSQGQGESKREVGGGESPSCEGLEESVPTQGGAKRGRGEKKKTGRAGRRRHTTRRHKAQQEPGVRQTIKPGKKGKGRRREKNRK